MDLYALVSQQSIENISRHCPRALTTYLLLVNRANTEGQVFLEKKTITDDLSESYRGFKNNVRKLALEGLLEWGEINGGISIILAELPDSEGE